MIIRPATVTNPFTTASLTADLALVDAGKDRTVRVVKRILSAGDMGNTTGKIQHADGCLAARFQGAWIQDVMMMIPCQEIPGKWIQLWNNFYLDTKTDFKTPYAVAWRISDDGYSLYVKDFGGGTLTGNNRLKAGNILYFFVLLGN